MPSIEARLDPQRCGERSLAALSALVSSSRSSSAGSTSLPGSEAAAEGAAMAPGTASGQIASTASFSSSRSFGLQALASPVMLIPSIPLLRIAVDRLHFLSASTRLSAKSRARALHSLPSRAATNLR